uniref:C2 domain-containing protein n=1 Tax=Scophthalmus maximus TaxID=52904 RepID=A0A8D3BAS3_SCOMX
MSTVLDETAADVPVRDITVHLNVFLPTDSLVYKNARARQDIGRVSREELEDRFLRLHEETLLLKQHVNNQDDKIRKLGTKLMRLVKDRGRMEQLAAGSTRPVSRVRDLEMEEMLEELQEKVRALQAENEGLKRRLLLAKQQLVNSKARRPPPYRYVHSRVNSGLRKLRDDSPPPPLRPKRTRSPEESARPPALGQLPRYGHSLLEEARAEIRNLENVIESQQSHMEEAEAASEQLREVLRRKEAEHEERLLQVRQQQTTRLSDSVAMIKQQKQLADRSNSVAELQGRFLQLQESQRTLTVSHDAAMLKVDELSAQLKVERLKSLDVEKRLQHSVSSVVQLQQQISELQQEKDLLMENNQQLVNRSIRSRSSSWLQISQLETALKADLVDKNQILDRIKAERDVTEKLTEENKKLQIQFLEQKQQTEELADRLKFYSRENEVEAAELTEALLLVKTRRSQRSGDLVFLNALEDPDAVSVRELRAAHAETIQELEKTRNILSTESKISRNYKVELEAVVRKMNSDKVEYEQKLERQAQLLDTRTAKIRKLEAQLRDVAYGTKTFVFRPDVEDEEESDDFDETRHLERGENLLELQIVSASLCPSALEVLGDGEPSTFCTYSFYLFELHSTPVVTGHSPRYGFTSKYVVSVDERLLDHLRRHNVTVELHQSRGLDWTTLATAQLPLQQLLERDGKIHGTVPLVGPSADGTPPGGSSPVGSLDYWLRLRIPMTQTLRLYNERVTAVSYLSSALRDEAQPQQPISSQNQLSVAVHRCGDLPSRSSRRPSPYVVYRFFDSSDHATATVHDSCEPQFHDLRSYSVPTDSGLDRYLRTEALHFYVFDYKEEQMDTYLGKARVPLLPLAQDEAIAGLFELIDPSGLPVGHIHLSLTWTTTYRPPSDATARDMVPEEAEQEQSVDEETGDKVTKDKDLEEILQEEDKHVSDSKYSQSLMSVLFLSLQRLQVVSATREEEEDNEDESHFSEGQLLPAAPRSDSDGSEVSEEIINVQVEVVSLSLRAESRVARDDSVMRLYVEFSFLDLPTEETPLSLPKPPPGRSVSFNYSKVIPVDAEENGERRQLLRQVLQGRIPELERIRFTVVSEPPEEEEQERECEDVGVAYLRINHILETRQDLTDTTLNVVDVRDNSEVLGSLTVSVEGLEALQAVMEDQDHKRHRPVTKDRQG